VRSTSSPLQRTSQILAVAALLGTLVPTAPPAIGAVPPTSGRSFSQSGGQTNTAFDASVELVTLSVSVRDDSGAPLVDLTAADFVIVDDGIVRQAALLLAPGATPLDIALLVDLSGSMRDRNWRDRARDFLDRLRLPARLFDQRRRRGVGSARRRDPR